MPACPWCCSISCRPAPTTATHSPRARSQKMRKAEPAAFMYDGAAKLIDTGNLEDDLAKLGDCDWIVEAVLERTDIKQALYRKLEGVRRPGSAIQLQHLDHRLENADRGHERDVPPRLPDHSFLQPAALYAACWKSLLGRIPIPETVAAVAAVRRRRARQECHPVQGQPRLHRQPARHLLDADGGERRRSMLGLTVEEADAIVGRRWGFRRPACSD